MESEPMLIPREESPLSKKFSSEEDRNHIAASSRTASPTHNQRAISAPLTSILKSGTLVAGALLVIYKVVLWWLGPYQYFKKWSSGGWGLTSILKSGTLVAGALPVF